MSKLAHLLAIACLGAQLFVAESQSLRCPRPNGSQSSGKHRAGLALSDFLHVIITCRDLHHRAKAHRSWRKLGVPALIVTDVGGEELNELNKEGAEHNEIWIQVEDTPWELGKPVLLRAATAPFLAQATPYRGKYKWIFYGDDDTMVNFFALRHTLLHWDSNLPYVVTDGFMQIPGSLDGRLKDSYSGALAPRCLPCHFAHNPVMAGMLAVPGRGNFTPPVGCPCTPRLACSSRPEADLPALQGGPEACARALATPSWNKTAIFGGYGVVFSAGLSRCQPLNDTARTTELIRSFLTARRDSFDGGDLLLSHWMASIGLWVTDPGSYWWVWEGDPNGRAGAFGSPALGGWVQAPSIAMLDGRCFSAGGEGGGGGRCLQHFHGAVSQHFNGRVVNPQATDFGRLFTAITDVMERAEAYYRDKLLRDPGLA